MSESLLVAQDVSKIYRMGPEELLVLDGLGLELHRGEIVAVVGASGVGKSTLLNVLGLLDSPDRGKVLSGGVDLFANPADLRAEWRNRVFGFVFQFYHLIPELNAVDNVLVPTKMYEGDAGPEDMRSRAIQLLTELGLGERLKHRPKQLSGGERQRVAIARALINRPDVLLCDEPTGNLDTKTSEGVQKALWELNERYGQTMLIVTHEKEIADRAHRVLRMIDGKLVEERGPASPVDVEPAPVGHAPVVVRRMPLAQALFSLEGRIGRLAFFLGWLMLLLAGAGLRFLEGLIMGEVDLGVLYGLAKFVAFTLLMLWPTLALAVKRCHDLDRTGWFFAIALIPVVGPIWFMAMALFVRGTPGTNRFGPDPRRPVYGTRPGPRPGG